MKKTIIRLLVPQYLQTIQVRRELSLGVKELSGLKATLEANTNNYSHRHHRSVESLVHRTTSCHKQTNKQTNKSQYGRHFMSRLYIAGNVEKL